MSPAFPKRKITEMDKMSKQDKKRGSRYVVDVMSDEVIGDRMNLGASRFTCTISSSWALAFIISSHEGSKHVLRWRALLCKRRERMDKRVVGRDENWGLLKSCLGCVVGVWVFRRRANARSHPIRMQLMAFLRGATITAPFSIVNHLQLGGKRNCVK